MAARTFSYPAPNAKRVQIMAEFNGWRGLDMVQDPSTGIWSLAPRVVPGTYGYKFLVDDLWLLDPANSFTKIINGTDNSAAAVSPLGEIWIALRDDGLPGSGAPWDALDGAATDIGSILLNIPEYTAVHLGPGVFLTSGILLRKGCKLIGAARDVTVIRKQTAQPFGAGFGSSTISCYGDGTDTLVADLTVDCNGDALAAKYNTRQLATTAVGLTGDNCTIRNVRAIHVHGGPLPGGPESFPLFIDNDCKAFCSNGLIENCLIDQYCADSYGGTISIFDNRRANTVNWVDGSTNMSDSVIRNCTIIGNVNGTSCFGVCGDRLTIENCIAIGSSTFFYYDTALSRDITIRGCRAFVGSGYGIDRNAQVGFILMNLSMDPAAAIKNFLVEDNDVVLFSTTPNNNDIGLAHCWASPFLTQNKNWKFKNNHIGWDARSTSAGYLKLNLAYMDGVKILGNTQDKGGGVDLSLSTNVTYLDP